MSLRGRIALVTGASRGLGAAVAKEFAALGAHVILVARSLKNLENIDDEIQKSGKGSATIVPLNLMELDKIDQLAINIAERFGRLDIMVGNAAILGGLRPIDSITNKTWDQVMTLNVAANFRLLRVMHPLLKKSESGRAIFVTSGVAESVYPFFAPYSVSKAALEMLVKTYAAENEKTNIKANLIDPGILRTDMRAEAFPGEDPNSLPLPESIANVFAELADASCKRNGEVVRCY